MLFTMACSVLCVFVIIGCLLVSIFSLFVIYNLYIAKKIKGDKTTEAPDTESARFTYVSPGTF